MASYLGWTAVQIVSADDPATGESSSRWVLLTSNPDFFERAGLAHHALGLEQPRAHSLDRRFRQPVARSEVLTAISAAARIEYRSG